MNSELQPTSDDKCPCCDISRTNMGNLHNKRLHMRKCLDKIPVPVAKKKRKISHFFLRKLEVERKLVKLQLLKSKWVIY